MAEQRTEAKTRTDQKRFAVLKKARRVWAVGSIHGEAERLARLHARIDNALEPGDRIVYCGNLIGRGPDAGGALDELLRFRRLFLARPGNFACDLAYLRGGQEEMWQKLLQLQFATDPRGVLEWMLDQGLDASLAAYSQTPEDARRAAGGGPMQLTRWTGALRQAMQARPGHHQIFSGLRRAAFTEERTLLFVNAGLDPTRPLDSQMDSFWWSSGAFSGIEEPYDGFKRVIRGYAPRHPGLVETAYTLTLDADAGRGGPVLAALVLPDGEVAQTLEA